MTRISLIVDGAALDRASDRLVRNYLGAATKSVATVTRRLEQRLEAGTQAAVPGRLWRAWKSSAYPKSGPARAPVGTVWLNGGARTRGAFRFWTMPGSIRGKSGQFLAIPLPAAGSRGRSRDLTPGEWERRTGQRLRFVYRPGRASLLVAEGTLGGRGQGFRPITRRRTAADQARGWQRGQATIPIFVLVPAVPHRNAFAIEPIVNASDGDLAAEFFAAIRALS